MIHLTASALNGDYTFTLTRGDDELLLISRDWTDVAERLLALGVDNPLPLIKAAEQWGAVDIREEVSPDWTGGNPLYDQS